MKNAYLIGERLYLRPIEPNDVPLFLQWFNDEDVRQYLGMIFPMNSLREEEWVKKLYESRNDLPFLMVLKEGDRPIGSVGLHRIDWVNRFAIFAIAIGDKGEWNKGYGREAANLMLVLAFEKLNLNKVELQVYEYNVRGIRCYESVGYRLEGRLRARKWRDGRYWDVFQYGILRDEWFAAKNANGDLCQAEVR